MANVERIGDKDFEQWKYTIIFEFPIHLLYKKRMGREMGEVF